MEQLPETVDRYILECRALFAVKAIREARNCSLYDAVDVYVERYEELRRERPDDFAPDTSEASTSEP